MDGARLPNPWVLLLVVAACNRTTSDHTLRGDGGRPVEPSPAVRGEPKRGSAGSDASPSLTEPKDSAAGVTGILTSDATASSVDAATTEPLQTDGNSPPSGTNSADASLEGYPAPERPCVDASVADSACGSAAPDSTLPGRPGPSPVLPVDASVSTAVDAMASVDDDIGLVFTDVGSDAGIDAYQMASGPRAGICAEDYDGDGLLDLFVPTGEGSPDRLYRNRGDGTFVDVASNIGLGSREKHRTALWFDCDDDADLDLVIASDCRGQQPGAGLPCPTDANLWLYQRAPTGQFVDITSAAGLDVAWGGYDDQHRAGMAAGDIDDDGDLDLVVPGWNMRALVFRNEGDCGFSDATVEIGLPEQETAYYQRAVLHDFDEDGFMDLFLTVDIFEPNALYRNQGDGTFVDVAKQALVDNPSTNMGVTIGDFDNDTDFDFYVTVITQETFANPFFRNDSANGELTYTNIAAGLGVENGGWGWGTTFFDADNDGWLDLATTNGSPYGVVFARDPSRFWHNPGVNGQPFRDRSIEVNFDDIDIASGLAAFDFDGDGDQDLVQAVNDGGPLRLLRNDRTGASAQNGYLVVRPRQPGANHWAIGAKVLIRTENETQVRPILAGISTDSQEPAEAFFGVGDATSVDELVITWPGSARERTVLTDVATNQVLTVMRE